MEIKIKLRNETLGDMLPQWEWRVVELQPLKSTEETNMTDLTKITTPFGLLDEKTQQALYDASVQGKEFERLSADGAWCVMRNPSWVPGFCYRVRPEPETTTVYVNLWRGRDGRVFPTSFTEDEAPVYSPPSTWTLIARGTVTITHGEGL